MTCSIRTLSRLAVLALALPFATGCVSLAGDTPEAKRSSALAMRDEVMLQATEMYPELQADLDASTGYVVLDSGIFKTLIGHVGGHAVAFDKVSQEVTYFKHSAWCLGPLLEFGFASSVIVFHDRAAFDALLAGDYTWKFGADVDASFRFGDFGGGVDAMTASDAASIYRVFQSGLGLNATLFWVSIEPDPELNP